MQMSKYCNIIILIVGITIACIIIVYAFISVINCCAESLKIIVTIVGGLVTIIVAIFGLYKGIHEYDNHLKKDRIRYLISFGEKYTSNQDIKDVVCFLEELEDNNQYKSELFNIHDNTYKEAALSIHSLEMFMRFIEELELLIRCGAISESSALYLFGHYTEILDRYQSRWPSIKYNEEYWTVFRSFVERAKHFNYNNVKV